MQPLIIRAFTPAVLNFRTCHLGRFSTLLHVGKHIPLTSELRIVSPGDDIPPGVWPAYQIMDEHGAFQSSEPVDSSCGAAAQGEISSSMHFNIESLVKTLGNKHPSYSEFLSSLKLVHNIDHAYRLMIRLRQMDDVLQDAQRQGRISFYMTCRGEEAIHIGSASALEKQDIVLAQYREAGLLMWRGFTLDQFANQCFSNDLDLGKGR
jgi:hypothetical protein